MKRKSILVAGVVVIAVTAYFLFSGKEAAKIEVETVQVKSGSIRKIVTATGTVEPITQVEVGTQVSGVIEKIYVDYNSSVKANQLIAELDRTALAATVEEAQASLNTALNEQNYLQKSYERIAKLHESKVVSDTDYEEALYKYNNAKGIADQKKSDLSRAQTNLGYTRIYSPINGVVISRSVDEGQTVAASYSTPTLFTIAQDLRQMQVEADVDEADIGQVKEGQRVVFTVDAYPEDQFAGVVTQVRLEPIETSNVITYTVIIKAQNEDGKLMPGLTASISIYTLEVNDILTLEAKALAFQPDQQLLEEYFKQQGLQVKPENITQRSTVVPVTNPVKEEKKEVWIKSGNQLVMKSITTSITDGISVQVLDGLSEGDEVVYALKTKSEDGTPEGNSGSPFMPKPPGAKKK